MAFPVYWQAVEEGWDWIEAPAKAPDYVTMKWPTRCGVIISEDQGRSFSIYGDLRADYPLWENNVCELPDRSLLMLMRAEFSGVLYRSMSYDMGKHGRYRSPQKFLIQIRRFHCAVSGTK